MDKALLRLMGGHCREKGGQIGPAWRFPHHRDSDIVDALRRHHLRFVYHRARRIGHPQIDDHLIPRHFDGGKLLNRWLAGCCPIGVNWQKVVDVRQ